PVTDLHVPNEQLVACSSRSRSEPPHNLRIPGYKPLIQPPNRSRLLSGTAVRLPRSHGIRRYVRAGWLGSSTRRTTPRSPPSLPKLYPASARSVSDFCRLSDRAASRRICPDYDWRAGQSRVRASRTRWSLRARAERAASRGAPDSRATRARRRSPPAAARACRQAGSSAPVACSRMVSIRPRSLALVATTPTMRLEYTRPRRTNTAVENALSTSFWAVAAFIRVDPVTTSGPVSTPTNTSTSPAAGACGLAV